MISFSLSEVKKRLEASAAGRQWQWVKAKPHHGIVVPLFSLHGAHSAGIGEFLDLLPLIEWCSSLGMDVIQLLPLNDTGQETSPYNALSAFALNPIHLSLSTLPHLSRHAALQTQLKEMGKNQPTRVDYKKVRREKDLFLREYYHLEYQAFCHEEFYRQFLITNPWLTSYALFKALKILHGDRHWQEWESCYRDPINKEVKEFISQHNEEIDYQIFVQFLAFEQMKAAKRYASTHHLMLKGDIPILISRDSADVWFHRSLFSLQFSAGAPPDMYSKRGQNWGFPIYNWEEIEKGDYLWWQWRLAVAEQCYHLYRLDHIVGFFRLWAFPFGDEEAEGCFFPKEKNLWIPHGTKIMKKLLQTTSLLPIGEDLGTVPPEVRVALRELGICGTKVMRWERAWEEDRRFIEVKDYIPESMTTVSTHDSTTLQLWWRDSPDEAEEYAASKGWSYCNGEELSLEKRYAILRDSHHSASLFHINLLQEYFPFVAHISWDNPEEERINVPGVISEQNWSYRFRPTLEEMISNEKLHRLIKQLLK